MMTECLLLPRMNMRYMVIWKENWMVNYDAQFEVSMLVDTVALIIR